MKQFNFDEEERKRKEQTKILRKLNSPVYKPEKWGEIKSLVYKATPLDLDLVIDDTTLREGLQMAGLTSSSPRDMCRIACLLRDIGVEREEVVTYTKSDQKAIKMMQDEGLKEMLAAWCRASTADVDLALKLDFKQVGISHPVSYIHFEKWRAKSIRELVERVVSVVEYAVSHGLKVFVHGEDSTRADWNFEKKFINAVADVGAHVYRICDTVGCGYSDPSAPLPSGIPMKIRRIKEETKIPYVEIHAHDDLGNAVENTMTAINAASGLYDKFYVSTTFLGIGDRSGNAETEKIILNCYFRYNIRKWRLEPLKRTANFIASSLNYWLPLNKAIVGEATFAHESGIHVHGIQVLPLTYEIFPPEMVGQKRSILIGKRSGKHAIATKLKEVSEEKIDEADPRLKELIDVIKREYAEKERKFVLLEREFKEFAESAGFQIKKSKTNFGS
jgi:isopropylmalate/homocitrate/citramalate synthase